MTKKKIAILGLACISAGLVVAAVSSNVAGGLFSKSFADAEFYGTTLDGENGAITDASLKTKTASAKTESDGDVTVEYKNMVAVSGKIGKIKANGFYGNRDPFCGMSHIKVTSDASVGDAVLKYGLTSACLDGEVDLTEADGSVTANYFKIVAKNEVTIESIEIQETCDASNNGFAASYGATDNRANYEFIKSGDHYQMRAKSASSTHYEDKIVVPDFYGTGDDFGLVTELVETGSYGIFEKLYAADKIIMPETITTFGKWFFGNGSYGEYNNIESFTYPRDLKTMNGTGVPKSEALTTVYYNCVNLTSSSGSFNKNNQPNLKDVYISYDVEKLPNSFVTSFPTDVTLHYEGTEAEWATLVSSASNWKVSNVICSDTTTSTVTLVYPNATLGDVADTKDIVYIDGKSIADPGKPTWTGEGVKIFDGWYTASDESGVKVSFPYAPTGDVQLFAHFIDKPAGYAATDPVAISLGTANVNSGEDLGDAYYVSYTATVDETIEFTALESDITMAKNATSTYKNCELRIFNADGSRATTASASNSPEESVKKFAILSKGGTAKVKVRFAAGETYIIGWSANSFNAGAWGEGKITAAKVDDSYGDYTAAETVTIGDTLVSENIPSYGHKWAKFTASESGDYTFDFNNFDSGDSSFANASIYVGTIDETGKWTLVTNSNYSHGVKFATLTAGQTYYIAISGNSAGKKASYNIYKGTPAGYSASNPITLPVDGTQVSSVYNSYSPNYYTFTISSAGTYKLSSDKTLNTSASPSWSNATPNVLISKDAAFESENLVSHFNRQGKLSSSNDLFVDLEAGTYYMKASVSSSSDYKLSLAPVADATGLTLDTAINISIADAEGQTIALSDVTGQGTLYKFTAVNKYYVITTDEAFTELNVGTLNGASSYVPYFSNSLTVSSSTKEGHKKLTAGETYIYVRGESITHINVDVVETIKDGESRDTAWDYALGSEQTLESSTRYWNITGIEESGSYILTTDAPYASQFKLYCGDSTVTYSGTDSKRVYALDSAKSYRIEAYASGKKFKLIKAEQGVLASDPLAISVSSTDTAVLLENKFNSDGTFYGFTTDYAGWYEFSLSDANASVEVIVGSTVEGTVTSDSVVDVKPGAGKSIVLHVISSSNGNVALDISHPEAVHNGKSIETAFVFEPDAGYAYKQSFTWTGGREYVYWEVDVVSGTNYVFELENLSGGSDKTDSAGIKVCDSAGNQAYSTGSFGDVNQEVHYDFVSSITGKAYIYYRHYAYGPQNFNVYFYPKGEDKNTTVSSSFEMVDFGGAYAISGTQITATLDRSALAIAATDDEVGSFANGGVSGSMYFVSGDASTITVEAYIDDENCALVTISQANGVVNKIVIENEAGDVFGIGNPSLTLTSGFTFTPAN